MGFFDKYKKTKELQKGVQNSLEKSVIINNLSSQNQSRLSPFEKFANRLTSLRNFYGYNDIINGFFEVYGNKFKELKRKEDKTEYYDCVYFLRRYMKKKGYDVYKNELQLLMELEEYLNRDIKEEVKKNIRIDEDDNQFLWLDNFYTHYHENYPEYIDYFQELCQEYGNKPWDKEVTIRYLEQLKEYDNFVKSENYIYIKKFVEKGKGVKEGDLSKLSAVLSSKGIKFDIEVCIILILRERERIKKNTKLERVKEHVIINQYSSLDDYILNFYTSFPDDYQEYIEPFCSLLIRSGISISESEMIERIDKIKIQFFEDDLLSDNRYVNFKDIKWMNGYEFEKFLTSLFIKMGYKVENTKLSGDQGADLIIQKSGKTTVVQAKNFQGSVGNQAIQQIVAAIRHYNANNGMVVCTSTYTASAIELAKSNSIELWDGENLNKKMELFPISKN